MVAPIWNGIVTSLSWEQGIGTGLGSNATDSCSCEVLADFLELCLPLLFALRIISRDFKLLFLNIILFLCLNTSFAEQ